MTYWSSKEKIFPGTRVRGNCCLCGAGYEFLTRSEGAESAEWLGGSSVIHEACSPCYTLHSAKPSGRCLKNHRLILAVLQGIGGALGEGRALALSPAEDRTALGSVELWSPEGPEDWGITTEQETQRARGQGVGGHFAGRADSPYLPLRAHAIIIYLWKKRQNKWDFSYRDHITWNGKSLSIFLLYRQWNWGPYIFLYVVEKLMPWARILASCSWSFLHTVLPLKLNDGRNQMGIQHGMEADK